MPIPYLPPEHISPADFVARGKHLNQRQLRKRVKRRGASTSPNKSRRKQAWKGYKMGRTKRV